jgi:hypothetical protein
MECVITNIHCLVFLMCHIYLLSSHFSLHLAILPSLALFPSSTVLVDAMPREKMITPVPTLKRLGECFG